MAARALCPGRAARDRPEGSLDARKEIGRALISQLEHPIAASVAADGGRNPVALHVPAQHVCAMTAGFRPPSNGTIFRVAAKANVLRSGTSLRRNTFTEAGMVEALASGKALRMAMGSAIQRAARRQRRAAVLGAI